jgi:hypothetical protein
MPSPYRREELIADTATLVYLLSGSIYDSTDQRLLFLNSRRTAPKNDADQQNNLRISVVRKLINTGVVAEPYQFKAGPIATSGEEVGERMRLYSSFDTFPLTWTTATVFK